MQNSSGKRTKWCGNGPKIVYLGPKMTIFFASNGSLWGHFHTTGCIFLTSFAPRVVPPHVSHFNPPFEASGASYGPKMAFFAPNGPLWGHFHTTGCIFLTSFATRVVPAHMLHCEPPFDPLLPAIWSLCGP